MRKRTPDRIGPACVWFTLPRMEEIDAPALAAHTAAKAEPSGHPRGPATGPVPGSPKRTVYGLAAQIRTPMSTLVRRPKLMS